MNSIKNYNESVLYSHQTYFAVKTRQQELTKEYT